MPQITQENLDRLICAEKLLLALQECGVNNWEGYEEAVRIAFLSLNADSEEGDDVI